MTIIDYWPCPTCGQPINEHMDMLIEDFEIHITTPDDVKDLPEIDAMIKAIFRD